MDQNAIKSIIINIMDQDANLEVKIHFPLVKSANAVNCRIFFYLNKQMNIQIDKNGFDQMWG